MSVTDDERNKLYVWFEEHMGSERAAIMMRVLPPVGWNDIATRRDLDHLGDRLDARIDGLDVKLDARIDGLDVKLDARIDAVEVKLDGAVAQMATKADMSDLRAEFHESFVAMQRSFVTWLLTAQAAVVGLVGIMLAALH
jgi:hypothetical protein